MAGHTLVWGSREWLGQRVEGLTAFHGTHGPENTWKSLGLPVVLENASKVIQHLEIPLPTAAHLMDKEGRCERVCVGKGQGAVFHSPRSSPTWGRGRLGWAPISVLPVSMLLAKGSFSRLAVF